MIRSGYRLPGQFHRVAGMLGPGIAVIYALCLQNHPQLGKVLCTATGAGHGVQNKKQSFHPTIPL